MIDLFESFNTKNLVINSLKHGFLKPEFEYFKTAAYINSKFENYNYNKEQKYIQEHKDFINQLKQKYNIYFDILVDLFTYKVSKQYIKIFKQKYGSNKLFKSLFTQNSSPLYRVVFLSKDNDLKTYKIKDIESFSKDKDIIYKFEDVGYIHRNRKDLQICLIVTNKIKQCLDISGIKLYSSENEVLCLSQQLNIKSVEKYFINIGKEKNKL